MPLKRWDFINLAALTTATGLVSTLTSCKSNDRANEGKSPLDNAQLMMNDVVPISVNERVARIEKAQRLLSEQNIEALILDSGTPRNISQVSVGGRVKEQWLQSYLQRVN